MTHYLFICCLLVSGTVKAADLEAPVGEKRGASALALEQAPPQRQRVERVGEIGQCLPQIYGFATYDALFKYVLGKNEKVRTSFLHAFLSTLAPDVDSSSSERLDDHMNPLEDFQRLRKFVHDKDTQAGLEELKAFRCRYVVKEQTAQTNEVEDQEMKKATAVLQKFVSHFSDIKKAFPKARYDETMDFVCKMKNGSNALIEMQVVPQNCWDRGPLAYAAHFYGKQLTKGEQWKSLKKVIAINILGGGRDELPHWKETPEQFMRHYKFQEQIHPEERFIDGIELIQCSLMNAPEKLENKEQEDWITFLRRSAFMTPEEVEKTITTPEVLEAFECAKLPAEVRKHYEEQDEEYRRYSQFTRSLVDDSKAEGEQIGLEKGEQIGLEKGERIGKLKGKVEAYIEVGLSDEDILEKIKELTPEDLQEIKADIAAEQSSPVSQRGYA